MAVAPNADLQALIDANPPRTTFCFARGLYAPSKGISVRDKSPTFDLRAGAIIDGRHGSFIGIDGPDNQRGMRVLGGTFQHFGNAEAPDWVTPVILRGNSVIKGTEFRENFNAGVAVQGSNVTVSDAYIHNNGMYGLVVTPACADCSGPTGVIIEDSEIAFNNTRHLPTGDAAGGTKFVYTKGMIVRNNEVHDNYGSGLWWDGYNADANVYGNDVYQNRNWGIFWELSYGGTRIHNNTLTDNGMGNGAAPTFFNNVQLLVSASDGKDGGIEIYENKIEGAAYPLGLINHGGHLLLTRGVYVHNNVMTLRSPSTKVGAVAFDGLNELFGSAANNHFADNAYRVPDPSGAYWLWNGQVLTWTQWQNLGQDVGGTEAALT